MSGDLAVTFRVVAAFAAGRVPYVVLDDGRIWRWCEPTYESRVERRPPPPVKGFWVEVPAVPGTLAAREDQGNGRD